MYRARLAYPVDFVKLVDFVEWKLIEMPIPRLQVLGGQEVRFLYEYNWAPSIRQSTISAYQRGTRSGFDNRLLFRAGVAESLVRINGILRPLFYRKWAVMVAGLNGLPEAILERFLFGSERTSLDDVRGPLRDIQEHRCFYCSGRLGGTADVDHFIPWSRHPDDGLDNLVAAHPTCNNSKRDFLAAAEHVERWSTRSQKLDADLTALARVLSWPRDANRTRSVATAIYSRLPRGAPLWAAPSRFVPVERTRILNDLGGGGDT